APAERTNSHSPKLNWAICSGVLPLTRSCACCAGVGGTYFVILEVQSAVGMGLVFAQASRSCKPSSEPWKFLYVFVKYCINCALPFERLTARDVKKRPFKVSSSGRGFGVKYASARGYTFCKSSGCVSTALRRCVFAFS